MFSDLCGATTRGDVNQNSATGASTVRRRVHQRSLWRGHTRRRQPELSHRRINHRLVHQRSSWRGHTRRREPKLNHRRVNRVSPGPSAIFVARPDAATSTDTQPPARQSRVVWSISDLRGTARCGHVEPIQPPERQSRVAWSMRSCETVRHLAATTPRSPTITWTRRRRS